MTSRGPAGMTRVSVKPPNVSPQVTALPVVGHERDSRAARNL